MKEEIWKKLDINNNYYISNYGKLKRNEKIIKGWVQNTGYRTVNINNKKYSLHRLIAINFIENKNNKPFINHIDGNKLNNRIDNLEWCTQKENNQHAFRTGRMDNAIKLMVSKKIRAKKVGRYDLEGNLLDIHIGTNDIGKELNICSRNIRSVCLGKRNKAGGYHWKYLD